MKSDVEIAQSVELIPMESIASKANLRQDDFELWGSHKAKVFLESFKHLSSRDQGDLVLVTTINPTPSGEGKTTVAIGLAQALQRLGKSAMVGIREPSLGPCFGIKGGAAGGGYSQVLPMEDINLHFTGDMYAIAAAHNLLASILDNHIHHGNKALVDPREIMWPRVTDISDRALRGVVVGLGGHKNGLPHEERFDITAASEVMAVLCLCSDIPDLKERLSRILVAYDYSGNPVIASELNSVGAMAMLMKHAIKPNLVQTVEGTPAFIHGGPFANIAHGASSIISTRMGLHMSDYFVTEAGFGSDLGAEKFFNIVCRTGGFRPSVVVMVVTTRALKWHGGVQRKELGSKNLEAMKKGMSNLSKHLENVQSFGLPVVISINVHPGDDSDELDHLSKLCDSLEVPYAITEVFEKGGSGGQALAEEVIKAAKRYPFRYLYKLDNTVREKIELIAKGIYGADRINYTVRAEKDLERINSNEYHDLPICMAKTQYSLSDDPHKRGRPRKFKITVRELRISAGAGFIVPVTGEINTMPGLPARPAAEGMDIEANGRVKGLF